MIDRRWQRISSTSAVERFNLFDQGRNSKLADEMAKLPVWVEGMVTMGWLSRVFWYIAPGDVEHVSRELTRGGLCRSGRGVVEEYKSKLKEPGFVSKHGGFVDQINGLVEFISSGGSLPPLVFAGGRLPWSTTYLLDGQHRGLAYLIADRGDLSIPVMVGRKSFFPEAMLGLTVGLGMERN